MKLYGLIGYPLGHSFSKKYFTEKFERQSLDCRFENFAIENISLLPAIIERHPSLEGLCVTIPYKEKVLLYLSEMSPEVKAINACNSVKIKDGKLYGNNTDAIGFEQSLRQKLQPHHSSALILGTGGAAKAVEYVLKKLGITCSLVSRSTGDNVITYGSLTNELVSKTYLIVNASPVGTFPKDDAYPQIPYEAITERHFLFDLVYNPPRTIFLQKGEERGAAIQNGFDMLVNQAEASWEIWNAR
ncbi:shikimate dehydrogenase [Terrimonas sp.]|uniref:shikimate dehydrogenase family protein n=1 Tax=Terrimonas sp. TaxID=1914338 RepID=UPI000D50E416|nr:shikimate dehydrogenase [Terrimonas sp.]PVD54166.1 shikimate dehydrogenase [Terrimonas sp.]